MQKQCMRQCDIYFKQYKYMYIYKYSHDMYVDIDVPLTGFLFSLAIILQRGRGHTDTRNDAICSCLLLLFMSGCFVPLGTTHFRVGEQYSM